MKLLLIYFSVLVGCLGLAVFASKSFTTTPCWCWTGDQGMAVPAKPLPVRNEFAPYGSYGSEADWSNPERIIPLDYDQTQGKQIFYQQCVWCHSDTTPAGPSNRSNVTPAPPLMNDGTVLNKESDALLKKAIALGGSAMGKSAMMPPYGKSLTPDEINDLIAYMRAIAVPAYHAPSGKVHTIWGFRPL